MEEYVKEFLNYLGYDEPYDEVIIGNATRAINAALNYAVGSVGAGFELGKDSLFTELVFIYADDFFNNRGVSGKVSGATRRMVQGTETQLKLDSRSRMNSPLRELLTGGERFY